MRMIFFTICAGLMLTACGGNGANPEAASPKPISAPASSSTTEITSLDRGRKLYKRCVTCHTLEDGGRHKVGPNLYGIFGATAGQKEGFNYSKVMAESDIVWTDENLKAYIENPAKFMPKNRMSFVGLRKAEDREAVLEYMRSEME